MKALLFGLLAITASLANASTFTDLESAFLKSRLPKTAEVKGHWAGRCARNVTPDAVLGGVFVFKSIDDEGGFPPGRLSMSYYWEREAKSDLFDKMSISQVENYPAIKKWFSEEQWQKVTSEDGSLVNRYAPSNSITFIRSVRYFEDEFENHILLRIEKKTEETTETTAYCYFDKRLKNDQTIEEGETVLFGYAKNLNDDWVTAENPMTDVFYKGVKIKNVGTNTVWVGSVTGVYPEGGTVPSGKSFWLKPGQILDVTSPYATIFRVYSIRFRAKGHGDGMLKIYGAKAKE